MSRGYKRKNTKMYLYIVFAGILILSIALLSVFELRVRPIISEVATSRAKSIAVRVISNVVNDTMAKENIKYNDLVSFQKNGEQNITAVTSNVVAINKLKATLTMEIEKKISNIDTMSTKIPLGNLLNQSFLSGLGPKIKIKMVPIGYATIDVKNEFTSAGINQTKHEIYLEISCALSILLPVSSEGTLVKTQIPVAETIIVGNVPGTYTNVEGQEKPDDAVLNLLPDGD